MIQSEIVGDTSKLATAAFVKENRKMNSKESHDKALDEDLRRVPDDEKGRIALIKNKAGKEPVLRHEKHKHETDCGTNRHPHCHPAVSTVPAVRAADD